MDAEEMGMTTEQLLEEVKKAIRVVLIGGQSYEIGSRKLTRADLSMIPNLTMPPIRLIPKRKFPLRKK